MSQTSNIQNSLANSPKNFLTSRDMSCMRKYPMPLRIDNYTSLLVRANGVDGSSDFVDFSKYNHNIQLSNEYTGTSADGHIKNSSEQHIFGTTSIKSPVISYEHLKITDHPSFNFDNQEDFTVDCWLYYYEYIYTTHIIYKNAVVVQSETSRTIGESYSIYLSQNLNLGFTTFTDDAQWHYIVEDTPIEQNQWLHVALVRHGSSMMMFKNGVKILEYIIPSNLNIAFSQGDSGTTDYDFDVHIGKKFSGYIDEVRISKGIARWTENFTPPTSRYIEL